MKLQNCQRWPRPLSGLILLLGLVNQTQAQSAAPVTEDDFLTDMPIVLSVSRLPQRLDETPGAVTILDRNMIRLSGARDVADLLRLVPGFQTSLSYEKSPPVASYHGGFDYYSNRMQVLVDGRSVYSPFFIGSAGAGLQTVALTDIERIEVLRGSNSAAYGARAFLGVINIVTRDTLDTLGMAAQLATGENGIQDVQARIGWGRGDARFRLSADRKQDNGLSGSNGFNQTQRLNFRADLHPDAQNDVQLRAGGLMIESGLGKATEIENPLRSTPYDSSYWQLDWRRNLGVDQDVAVSLSHANESYRDIYPLSLRSVGIADSVTGLPLGIPDSMAFDYGSGRSGNDVVSVQHTFRQGSALRVVWGGEFRSERVTSHSLYNTDAAMVTDFTRLFANAEWRMAQNLVLNAGAMAEKSSVSGDSVAPRVMLNWHTTEGQTLRAGVSKAYRPPSAFEKYGNVRFVVNDRLLQISTLARGKVDPERVLVHELGYLGDFPRLGLNLDVRAFHEKITGFVRHEHYSLANDTSLLPSNPWDYFNGEDFTIHGFEYQLKWQPWRGARFILNQAHTKIGSKDVDIAMAAPKRATTLSFFQTLPGGLDLSLIHQDSGPMSQRGAGGKDDVGMTRTDLRLALPLRFGANRGEVALVVQNLGSPYLDFMPEFQFRRRAFVTLRIEN
jgi:iron complex outermembrane receptor protein